MSESQIKSDVLETNEEELVDAMEHELTDEQLLQMAEGSCSWGANCNKDC